MRDAGRFLNAASAKRSAASSLHVLRACCSAEPPNVLLFSAGLGTPAALPAPVPVGDPAMTRSDLRPVHATDPGNLPSRAGETIAEVAFALLLVGVWLVTCVVG
jgi:hypothetical protein